MNVGSVSDVGSGLDDSCKSFGISWLRDPRSHGASSSLVHVSMLDLRLFDESLHVVSLSYRCFTRLLHCILSFAVFATVRLIASRIRLSSYIRIHRCALVLASIVCTTLTQYAPFEPLPYFLMAPHHVLSLPAHRSLRSGSSLPTINSLRALASLAQFGLAFSYQTEAMTGSTKDPSNPSAVAKICYISAVVYMGFVVFCGCQVSFSGFAL
jgi:ribonuclease kappa